MARPRHITSTTAKTPQTNKISRVLSGRPKRQRDTGGQKDSETGRATDRQTDIPTLAYTVETDNQLMRCTEERLTRDFDVMATGGVVSAWAVDDAVVVAPVGGEHFQGDAALPLVGQGLPVLLPLKQQGQRRQVVGACHGELLAFLQVILRAGVQMHLERWRVEQTVKANSSIK